MSNLDQNSSELPHGHEGKSSVIEHVPSQHLDHLRDAHEQQPRHETKTEDREEAKEAAASEALEIAPTTEEVKHPHKEAPVERRQGPITKKQLDHEFARTMKSVQGELPLAQKAFSKIIHHKAIEQTSDILGATIARPNALLAGSVGAFSLTLGIYIFAKTAGYSLSGFEPIAAFLIGWVAGLLFDYIRVMITGKRS